MPGKNSSITFKLDMPSSLQTPKATSPPVKIRFLTSLFFIILDMNSPRKVLISISNALKLRLSTFTLGLPFRLFFVLSSFL